MEIPTRDVHMKHDEANIYFAKKRLDKPETHPQQANNGQLRAQTAIEKARGCSVLYLTGRGKASGETGEPRPPLDVWLGSFWKCHHLRGPRLRARQGSFPRGQPLLHLRQ